MRDPDLKTTAKYDQTPVSSTALKILLTVISIVYGLFFLVVFLF
jgi:hypothetical protein